LADIFKDGGEWFTKVYDYCIRIEFQSRGTLHIHLCGWVKFRGGCSYSGNSSKGPLSQFVTMLAELFQSSIDVQCGAAVDTEGDHDTIGQLRAGLLNYVTGYNSKASDSLSWKSKEWASDLNNSKWLQCYRLLCKRAPLVPELVLDFSSKPMMIHTFSCAPLYAPLPHCVRLVNGQEWMDGKRPILGGDHRKLYNCYLKRTGVILPNVDARTMSFLDYARVFRYDAATDTHVRRFAEQDRRCAVGVNYAYELYDNYIGQFVAMNYPHFKRHLLWLEVGDNHLLCREPGVVPENTRFLSGALESGVRAGCAVNEAIRGRDPKNAIFTDAETMADAHAMRDAVLRFLLNDMVADLKLSGHAWDRRGCDCVCCWLL
jgi:hypothetical protein